LRAARLDIPYGWRGMKRGGKEEHRQECLCYWVCLGDKVRMGYKLNVHTYYFCDTTAFSSGTGTNSFSIFPLRS